MNIQQAFPSKFLKVADLAGNRPVVTIAHVTMEEIGDDSRGPRPVCYFIGKEKGLVLNRINAGAIEEIAGTFETDEWRGVKIMLKEDKTFFQGRRVPCIRVDRPESRAVPPRARLAAPPPPPPPPVEEEPPDMVDADDIPFMWLLPFIAPLAALGMLWS